MANACEKCGHFLVRCKCAELQLQAKIEQLEAELNKETIEHLQIQQRTEREFIKQIKQLTETNSDYIKWFNKTEGLQNQVGQFQLKVEQKSKMKRNYVIVTLIIAGSFWFGYLFCLYAHQYPDPFVERHIATQRAAIAALQNRTITEQMMSIQRQVGCELIDGEIGTETTPLVNAVVRAEKKAKKEQEERELCNKYAIESFDRMAKGGKK